MYCSSCGTPSVAGDRFCQTCGKELPDSANQVQDPSTGSAGDTAGPSGQLPESGPTNASNPSAWNYVPYPTGPPPGSGPSPFPGGGFGQVPQWQGPQNAVPGPLSPFGAPLARWWQRVGAMVLDGFIVGIPSVIVNTIVNREFGSPSTVIVANRIETVRTLHGGAHVADIIVLAALTGLYFAILNGTGRGQTVGNRAPGIAVRDLNTGDAIGFGRGVLRWAARTVMYIAFVIPGLVNDLYPLWDSRNQTLADKAARSVVIRLK